ncbi:MAG TPA: methyltransferase domain-containing protein [Bryobacteraceae bacterium]|nr:methyltransferase domain-containing protein [Bryobacteraceae bacterium]
MTKLSGLGRCAAIAAALLVSGATGAENLHPLTHRRIAAATTFESAGWLMRPERASEEHPDQALDAIGIQEGTTVADVGAGTGYFAWRVAKRVGIHGLVYGEDIQAGMLDQLLRNARARGLGNVRAVLGTAEDPRLPQDSIDVALLVNAYHEFTEPEKMLEHIRQALRPQGRLVIVEYRAEDPNVPVQAADRMTMGDVRSEVQPKGFVFERVSEVLPRQHILIFRKP